MQTDVLIVGGGAAGLMAALRAAPLRVTVLAKAPVGDGASSGMAQGGIAVAMDAGDTPAAHARDTLIAGAGLCDPRAVEDLTEAAAAAAETLITLGVRFDRTPDGALVLGQEGAHSARRIMHAGGDATGREIMRALGVAVSQAAHIDVRSGWIARELLVEAGRVVGARVRTAAGEEVTVRAGAVVLATGGIGFLFARTTNPRTAVGDGLAMAARAGAQLADLEFVQFHPTAMDIGGDPLPLATEALRGDGAILVDDLGVRFMAGAHPEGDLAPRDVVARAIWRQRAAGRRVFLDGRDAVGARFPQAFPTVFAFCQAAGIDPRRDLIPVVPAAHYHMGGVAVDLHGRTSMAGLWAGGEVSCTGVHGANRLASNGVLEAVVYGRRIAEDILGNDLPMSAGGVDAPPSGVPPIQEDAAAFARLRALAYDNVGVIRDAAGLAAAVGPLLAMTGGAAATPLANAALVAAMVATCAWLRRESRGSHFRADFPEPQAGSPVRTMTTLATLRTTMDSLSDGYRDRRPA